MTTEIAILNKAAIALATDSAVTISSQDRHDKIYDSADKLFELSNNQPIAIMIYNSMSFLEIPLPSLIKEYRKKISIKNTVEDAAYGFLEFLNSFCASSSKEISERSIFSVLVPFFEDMAEEFNQRFTAEISDLMNKTKLSDINDQVEEIGKVRDKILNNLISSTFDKLKIRNFANFVGTTKPPRFSSKYRNIVRKCAQECFPFVENIQLRKLIDIGKMALQKDLFSSGRTGIVVAGFGSSERFPSLFSVEIDGEYCGHLKYRITNKNDIDRNGEKAAIIPFAQKEMVDRFVFGIDDSVRDDILEFLRDVLPEFGESIIESLNIAGLTPTTKLSNDIRLAETKILQTLRQDVFRAIKDKSRKDIEDMVEFMPKPEMAQMAESLIDVTSIKRRVSRGLETVGGPIDVAIVSREEGFVWVKRKHYFPAELNSRYRERLKQQLEEPDVPGS